MEIVDKFDNKRLPLNITRERHEKIEGEYKQTVHTWIINSNNQFLIQKRSNLKKNNPNKWAATSGAVDTHELPVEAAIRECMEELSLALNKDDIELILSFRRKYNFTDVFLVRKDIDISKLKLQEEEVQDVKWATTEEIIDLIKEKNFAHSTKIYFEMFLKLLKNNDC